MWVWMYVYVNTYLNQQKEYLKIENVKTAKPLSSFFFLYYYFLFLMQYSNTYLLFLSLLLLVAMWYRIVFMSNLCNNMF